MRGIVYKYTNIHNEKVYIGQTINEPKRREKWFNLNAPYAELRIVDMVIIYQMVESLEWVK